MYTNLDKYSHLHAAQRQKFEASQLHSLRLIWSRPYDNTGPVAPTLSPSVMVTILDFRPAPALNEASSSLKPESQSKSNRDQSRQFPFHVTTLFLPAIFSSLFILHSSLFILHTLYLNCLKLRKRHSTIRMKLCKFVEFGKITLAKVSD